MSDKKPMYTKSREEWFNDTVELENQADKWRKKVHDLREENEKLKNTLRKFPDYFAYEREYDKLEVENKRLRELLKDARIKLTLPIYTNSEIALMKPLVDKIEQALKENDNG